MKHIRFYLDFISPYAYLAFVELPRALEGLSYAVQYQPVLFWWTAKTQRQPRPG